MEVRKVFVVLCLCVVFGSAVSKKAKSRPENFEDTYGAVVDDDVQNDDYDYGGEVETPPEENEPTESDDKTVKFMTQPGVFIANVGTTVRLPCEVTNQDIVMIWQRDEVLLFQGHVPVEKFPNIAEYTNGTLEIKLVTEKDYGNYSCILMTTNDAKSRPKIIHSVVPPTPPKIEAISSESGKNEFKPGQNLKLTCVATGYPKPAISWYKDSERLVVQGEVISIPNLTIGDRGIYRCLADNRVGHPSHHHISIYVEHPPKISVGKYLVTSNKEKDAELTCTVDAYPEPRVFWRKGDVDLRSEGNHNITVHRREKTIESVLLISHLTEEDFTTYTCMATNSLGKREEKLTLIKFPAVREFVKPEKSNKDVVLTWKVESKSPISTHEIQYRRKGDTDWKVAEPEVTSSENDMYTVTYTLKELEAGAYETRVRSKNEHGWSEFSDVMPFEGVLAKPGSSTHKNHHKKHHKEKELKEKHISPSHEATSAPQQQEIIQKEAPVGASQGNDSSFVKSSAAILCTALLFLISISQ